MARFGANHRGPNTCLFAAMNMDELVATTTVRRWLNKEGLLIPLERVLYPASRPV